MLFVSNSVCAQVDYLDELSEIDIQEAALAFINLTTSPGVEGINLEVNLPNRQSQVGRASLGFTADFNVDGWSNDGYWGGALVHGQLDEVIVFLDKNDQPLHLIVDRDILALHGSFGLSIPVSQQLRVRPFMSVSMAETTTHSKLQNILSELGAEILPSDGIRSTAFQSYGLTGSLQVDYNAWYQRRYRARLLGQYNVSYDDTDSEDYAYLDTWGWSQSLILKSELAAATRWHSLGRPWLWKIYMNYNDFLDQSTKAIGFTRYFEVGVGLDWEWNIVPFDWFGVRTVGLRAGYVFDKNLEGYNIGLTFQ